MKSNLSEIKKKTVSANQYIDSLRQPFREKLWKRKQTYKLKQEPANQLKKFAEKS